MTKAERVKNFCDTFQVDSAVLTLSNGQSVSFDIIDKWYEGLINGSKLSIEQRKKNFANKLVPFVKTYGRELLVEFYEHWTQMNENGKKLHFEKQTTFDLSRRLKTFKRNADTNFGKTKPVVVNNSPNVSIPKYGN